MIKKWMAGLFLFFPCTVTAELFDGTTYYHDYTGDDKIIIGNDTKLESKVLPDCTISNQKMHYDVATNSFSCETDATSAGGGDNLGNHIATMTLTTDFGIDGSSSTWSSSSTFNGPMLSTGSAQGNYMFAIYPQHSFPIFQQDAGALYLDNTNNTGIGLNIFSNQASPGGLGSLLRIDANNTGFSQPALHILNKGTSGGAAGIRLDGPAPQIELVETDQASPAGKYEWQVNGDAFNIAGRNAADNSFETIIRVFRKATTGGNYTAWFGTQTIRYYDGDDSNFIGLRAPDTIASNFTMTWPTADGSAGVPMTTNGAGTFSLAGSRLNIPNGTAPTASATGDIAFDTTDGTLIIHDGTAQRVFADDLKCMTSVIGSSGTWDNQAIPIYQNHPDGAITIDSVHAAVVGGTSLTYNIEERAKASLGSAGTDIYSADQAADTTGEDETSFSNAGIAADAHLVFTTGSSASSGDVGFWTARICYFRDVE